MSRQLDDLPSRSARPAKAVVSALPSARQRRLKRQMNDLQRLIDRGEATLTTMGAVLSERERRRVDTAQLREMIERANRIQEVCRLRRVEVGMQLLVLTSSLMRAH